MGVTINTTMMGEINDLSIPPEFSYTGTYTLIEDSDVNWRIKFTSSGVLTFTKLNSAANGIDAFVVGGGGAGGYYAGGGGGGGYTGTHRDITVQPNVEYQITIGSGGVRGYSGHAATNGGTSSAFGINHAGGRAGDAYYAIGGAGGSGGGSGNSGAGFAGQGGTDGGKGWVGNSSTTTGSLTGASGQGYTTREFNASGATLYSGGGGGGSNTARAGAGGAGGGGAGGRNYDGTIAKNGTANTGGGGGGARYGDGSIAGGYVGGNGGSGIVIIRNKRVSG